MIFVVSCADWTGTYKTRGQAERAIARFDCLLNHTIEEVADDYVIRHGGDR